MPIFLGPESAMPPGMAQALAAFRYRVFVERLGWPLTGADGAERDQFDIPDARYAVALDAQGMVTGCARLLPTTGPTLAHDVFGYLLDAPVASPTVWELTRFAALDGASVDALLRLIFRHAARHGVRELLTLSPRGVERLLRRRGIAFRRCGPRQRMEGRWIAAYRLRIPEDCLPDKAAPADADTMTASP